jgi:hypothetical protein
VGTPRNDPAGDDLRDVLDLSRPASGKVPQGDFAVERKDVRREEVVVDKLGIVLWRDTPTLLQMGLDLVFLSVRRTVS